MNRGRERQKLMTGISVPQKRSKTSTEMSQEFWMKTSPLIGCVQCEDICRGLTVKVVVSFPFSRKKKF